MCHLLWIYFLLSIVHIWSLSTYHTINKAPAKVTFRVQFSRLSVKSTDDPLKLKLCVEKLRERCFWKLNEDISWDGEQYKDKTLMFYIDNMATNLSLDVMIQFSAIKKENFPVKTINLANVNSKYTFTLYSLNLENFLTITVEHECEAGYYPPRQCTKVCFPTAGESECDGFGNKLCKGDLLYNAELDRCISNNCLKSNNPCRNGRCVSNALTIKCICLESYIGEYCQHKNPCYPNPCFNRGKCIPNGSSQSYRCSCLVPFTDSRCETKTSEKCPCPDNMKCNYSDNGVLQSCTADTSQNNKNTVYLPANDAQENNNKLKIGGLGSKQTNDWNQINIVTILIVGGGSLILLLCIALSLYLFCRIRDKNNMKRDDRTVKSPSTLYTDFAPKLNETTFDRSFSLDDNFIYHPAGSQIMQVLPNNFPIGSSTGYSLNSNSYQDNVASSFKNYPLHGGFICQQEYPITPMILQHSYTKNNNNSSISTTSSSLVPPMLPPRSYSGEMISSDVITKLE